jgi:hypothetical protein
MRFSRRLSLATRVALLTILANLLLFGALSPISHAQATSSLPKSWNDAVAQLVNKVAANISPSPVTVNVKNISSLDASYAGVIDSAVRFELTRHSFSPASADSSADPSAIQLQLTLSESAGEYVWVIQILNSSPDANSIPPIIVSVPKADFKDAEPDEQSLSLEKRFVWKQPEKFLDFAVTKNSSLGQPALLVLETGRLVVYKQAGSQWQLFRTTAIPQTRASRDPQGTIDFKEGLISVEGLDCAGEPDLAGIMQCKVEKPLVKSGNSAGTPLILGGCGGGNISLKTASGDWTETDTIQGYLRKAIGTPAVVSGNAIEFAGPVVSLQRDSDYNQARAIVHNLKTGDYEGYIVTANCSY